MADEPKNGVTLSQEEYDMIMKQIANQQQMLEAMQAQQEQLRLMQEQMKGMREQMDMFSLHFSQMYNAQTIEETLVAMGELGKHEIGAKNCTVYSVDPLDKNRMFTASKNGERTYLYPDKDSLYLQAVVDKEALVLKGEKGETLLFVPLENSNGDVIGLATAEGKEGGFTREDIKAFSLQDGRVGNAFRLGLENKALQQRATTDKLTHLQNRDGMEEFIRTQTIPRLNHDEPVSVVMFDIDHFKRFNDTYGHDIGDECLKLVAQTLRDNMRQTADNGIFRWGGEEMVAILPTDESRAAEIADRMRKAVEQASLPVGNGQTTKVTVSCGVSQFDKEETPTLGYISDTIMEAFDKTLQEADAALYRAKEGGRNQVQRSHSDPEPTQQASKDAEIVRETGGDFRVTATYIDEDNGDCILTADVTNSFLSHLGQAIREADAEASEYDDTSEYIDKLLDSDSTRAYVEITPDNQLFLILEGDALDSALSLEEDYLPLPIVDKLHKEVLSQADADFLDDTAKKNIEERTMSDQDRAVLAEYKAVAHDVMQFAYEHNVNEIDTERPLEEVIDGLENPEVTNEYLRILDKYSVVRTERQSEIDRAEQAYSLMQEIARLQQGQFERTRGAEFGESECLKEAIHRSVQSRDDTPYALFDSPITRYEAYTQQTTDGFSGTLRIDGDPVASITVNTADKTASLEFQFDTISTATAVQIMNSYKDALGEDYTLDAKYPSSLTKMDFSRIDPVQDVDTADDGHYLRLDTETEQEVLRRAKELNSQSLLLDSVGGSNVDVSYRLSSDNTLHVDLANLVSESEFHGEIPLTFDELDSVKALIEAHEQELADRYRLPEADMERIKAMSENDYTETQGLHVTVNDKFGFTEHVSMKVTKSKEQENAPAPLRDEAVTVDFIVAGETIATAKDIPVANLNNVLNDIKKGGTEYLEGKSAPLPELAQTAWDARIRTALELHKEGKEISDAVNAFAKKYGVIEVFSRDNEYKVDGIRMFRDASEQIAVIRQLKDYIEHPSQYFGSKDFDPQEAEDLIDRLTKLHEHQTEHRANAKLNDFEALAATVDDVLHSGYDESRMYDATTTRTETNGIVKISVEQDGEFRASLRIDTQAKTAVASVDKSVGSDASRNYIFGRMEKYARQIVPDCQVSLWSATQSKELEREALELASKIAKYDGRFHVYGSRIGFNPATQRPMSSLDIAKKLDDPAYQATVMDEIYQFRHDGDGTLPPPVGERAEMGEEILQLYSDYIVHAKEAGLGRCLTATENAKMVADLMQSQDTSYVRIGEYTATDVSRVGYAKTVYSKNGTDVAATSYCEYDRKATVSMSHNLPSEERKELSKALCKQMEDMGASKVKTQRMSKDTRGYGIE